jgi:hypothetical protein
LFQLADRSVKTGNGEGAAAMIDPSLFIEKIGIANPVSPAS